MQWRDKTARTLEQVVVDLVVHSQTESEAFQCLLRIYGREKLADIYRAWKARGHVFAHEAPPKEPLQSSPQLDKE